jgi:hypothetical protein
VEVVGETLGCEVVGEYEGFGVVGDLVGKNVGDNEGLGVTL